MSKLDLIATATFGLEAVVKREVEALGYPVTDSRDGRITYTADERGLVRSNLWLRSADRVYIKMAEFEALSFEDLFQNCAAIPWEEWIPPEGKFTVAGNSVKSDLHSVPDCQAIIKKAMVRRMQQTYDQEWFEETGPLFPVRFSILKNQATVMLDTSGTGLHKRGYRVCDVEAPIKETLAAALVQLSFFRPDRLLVDPMCGSGTLAIEAAMLGRNIAPGLSRSFASQEWPAVPADIWKEEKKAAFDAIDRDKPLRILACDRDKGAIEAARANALEAGVDDCIDFKIAPLHRLTASEDYGVIVTNPPYGQRIGQQKEMNDIYRFLSGFFLQNPTWSLFLITADTSFEGRFGRPADRRRKLYNGRIQTNYYQYYGLRPPKKA
jgi:putative N6-adenine-specific DNA methylase